MGGEECRRPILFRGGPWGHPGEILRVQAAQERSEEAQPGLVELGVDLRREGQRGERRHDW